MDTVHVLAPTLLEYLAARQVLRGVRVTWAGVRLARWNGAPAGTIVVVCGLAGALAPDVYAGHVLIPEQVGLPDGRVMPCDPALVQALAAGARSLGYRPDTRPLLTASSMIVGAEREQWFQRGFVAADMETGLLTSRHLRVATVRVALDSPQRDVSAQWLRSTRAMLQPGLWSEMLWLGRVAPPYALRAAHITRAGLGRLAATDQDA